MQINRALKAYPAQPLWSHRLRHVEQTLDRLAAVGLAPRPLHGGIALSDRYVPIAFLVCELKLGRPLDHLLQRQRWSIVRAQALVHSLAGALSWVHGQAISIGDFDDGNNIVLVAGKPILIDVGFTGGDEPGALR